MTGSAAAKPNLQRLLARFALHAITFLTKILSAATAALGLLRTTTVDLLITGPLLAAAGLGVTSLIHLVVYHRWPSRTLTITSAVAGAGLLPFRAGLPLLDSAEIMALALVLGLLPVIGSLAVAAGSLDAGTPSGSAAQPAAAPDSDESSLRELLSNLCLDSLLTEWHDTTVDIHRLSSGPRHTASTRLRVLVIGELHRRDPEGVQRWLDEDAAASPAGYLHDELPHDELPT